MVLGNILKPFPPINESCQINNIVITCEVDASAVRAAASSAGAEIETDGLVGYAPHGDSRIRPDVQCRICGVQCTFLVFRSGKCVVVGCQNLAALFPALCLLQA